MTDFTPTDEQKLLLAHDPLHHGRVMAGPGTGKSVTLVALLDELLNRKKDLRIRLLTFTRAATADLANKVLEHPSMAAQRPSTIHSFSISVLLRNPGAGDIPQPLRIADDWEFDAVVRPTLARRLGLSVTKLDDLVKEMAAMWESLKKSEEPKVTPEQRAKFIGGWKEHRQVYGYTLLAELPYALREALHNHPDLKGLDIDVLVVDEYQDLNACELDVLRKIAEHGCRIVAAGDADQSIYSLRKAAPEGILNFPNEYPGCDKYTLSATQRCARRIIEWANYVIAGDPDRSSELKPLAPKKDAPDGEVGLLSFKGEAAEPKGIAVLVKNLAEKEGIPFEEILILLRGDKYGRFSKPIKKHLGKLEIPVSDPESVGRLIEEDDHRTFIELYRLRANPTDSIAWASLLTLTKYISKEFIDLIYEAARTTKKTFAEALLAAKEDGFPGTPSKSASTAGPLIRRVHEWFEEVPLPEEAPEEGWGGWMLDRAKESDLFVEPSEEFVELLERIDSVVEDVSDLGRYIGHIGPLGKDLARAEGAGVRIMTMTGAKGLTVRATVIASVEEGIVPYAKADLGEERRLLYVGLTRAREFVFCTWARRRKGPTARSGKEMVNEARKHSHFFDYGPVASQDGWEYMKSKWGE